MNPRYVSIKDQRDIATGNVTTTDIVPEGATAIALPDLPAGADDMATLVAVADVLDAS